MKTKYVAFMVMAALLVITAACAIKTYKAYPGKTRSKYDVATIEPEPGVRILTLGAKTVDIESEETRSTGYSKAEVIEGDHTLRVIPSTINAAKSYAVLKAALKGGNEYVVRHENVRRDEGSGPIFEFWVENKETRETVSNRARSKNPFRPQ